MFCKGMPISLRENAKVMKANTKSNEGSYKRFFVQ